MESRLQIATLLLTIFVLANVTCVKVPIRPVFEKTGESTQMFANPMIGLPPDTLKTRARMHVHNQQRRYMSEKGRMQRAQARRFREVGVETMDSYIKAYQEQQENYQKEQEKKFINDVAAIAKDINAAQTINNKKDATAAQVVNNKKDTNAAQISNTKKDTTAAQVVNNKKDTNAAQIINNEKEYNQQPKPVISQKLDKTLNDLPTKDLNNQKASSAGQTRKKRLYTVHPENLRRGSQTFERDYGYNANQEYYNQYQSQQNEYAPTRYGQTYGRYTSIGNHEDAAVKFIPSQQVYAGDVSSLTAAALQHAPQDKEYSQISAFSTNEDYEASLAALLGKNPHDQIQGLNQLLQQSNANHKITGEDLRNVNINLKSSSLDVPVHYYSDNQENPTAYVPPTYVFEVDPNEAYQQVKDHTPITENVQDIADTRPRPAKIGPTHSTYVTGKPTTLTSSTNYYKVEVASEVKEIPTSESNLYHSSGPSYSSDTSGYDNLHYASQYEFGYRVRDPHTGNDFGHTEVSDGETASGSYHVLLPDGRLQKVKYHAGPDGYKADVTYH